MDSPETPSPQAKYAEFDAIKHKVEQAADARGKEIDPGIKDTVVALNAVGVCTEQSCEGHAESGMSAPWVEIGAPNQPEYQFVGQEQTFQSVADKHGISLEDIKRGFPHRDEWQEAVDLAKQKEETPEHIAWRKESAALKEKVSEQLAEFYQDRVAAPDTHIVIEDDKEGSFRIHNGGADYREAEKTLPASDKAALEERQARYRQEMQDFASFLKKGFLH